MAVFETTLSTFSSSVSTPGSVLASAKRRWGTFNLSFVAFSRAALGVSSVSFSWGRVAAVRPPPPGPQVKPGNRLQSALLTFVSVFTGRCHSLSVSETSTSGHSDKERISISMGAFVLTALLPSCCVELVRAT